MIRVLLLVLLLVGCSDTDELENYIVVLKSETISYLDDHCYTPIALMTDIKSRVIIYDEYNLYRPLVTNYYQDYYYKLVDGECIKFIGGEESWSGMVNYPLPDHYKVVDGALYELTT